MTDTLDDDDDEEFEEPPFNPDEYPVRVTFAFRSAEERDHILGGMSDGWGENYISFDWDVNEGNLMDASLIGIDMSGDEREEMERHKRLKDERLSRG